MTDAEPETLADTLSAHGLQLPAEQVARLDSYCRLLWEWNEKMNLTRHTDYEKFAGRDVMDSWQLAALLQAGEEVLDVGTGGGVPGVVLAILRPDLRVSLSESVGKKAKAVEAMVRELDLSVPVYPRRAEKVLEEFRYHALVVRAVGPLWKMLRWFEPHWASIGRLLVVKGPAWPDERNEARHRGMLNKLELRRAASYPMPGTNSESVILKIWPKGTPER
jgi:16S rRNA (guanine527-N7)-methyltransferase